MMTVNHVLPLCLSLVLLGGCGIGLDTIGKQQQSVIYGTDERMEYYEAPVAARKISERGIAALVSADRLSVDERGTVGFISEPHLCHDERFAHQPNAALCTAVVLGADLLLTAGHCVRAEPLHSLRAVFGYYYEGSERLAVTPEKILRPVEIVSERMDPSGVVPRLDYALIRVEVGPSSIIEPVDVADSSEASKVAEWTSISASVGAPLKFDVNGAVTDYRTQFGDFVIASTDTSKGSSGGGLFDEFGRLFAILARGADDFIESDAGCLRERVAEESAAGEEYTRVAALMDAICEDAPTSLGACRMVVGSQGATIRLQQESSCSAHPPPNGTGVHSGSGLCIALLMIVVRRMRDPRSLRELKNLPRATPTH